MPCRARGGQPGPSHPAATVTLVDEPSDAGSRRGLTWAAIAIVLALGWVVLLYDALRDLPAAGLFAGLLRLVVEAVAAVVTVAWAWRRRNPEGRDA